MDKQTPRPPDSTSRVYLWARAFRAHELSELLRRKDVIMRRRRWRLGSADLIFPATCPPATGPETGAVLVEYALVILMFLLLVFATFDFGRMFFVQMEVQCALQEAGRFASTGNQLPDPNNPGNYLSRVNSIIAIAEQAAPGIHFSGLQISSLLGGVGNAGGPGDTVTISLTTNLPLMTPLVANFFPNGQYTFTSSVTFKNEPFSTNNTQ